MNKESRVHLSMLHVRSGYVDCAPTLSALFKVAALCLPGSVLADLWCVCPSGASACKIAFSSWHVQHVHVHVIMQSGIAHFALGNMQV